MPYNLFTSAKVLKINKKYNLVNELCYRLSVQDIYDDLSIVMCLTERRYRKVKRSELILRVSKNINYDTTVVENVLSGITDEIICSLKNGDSVGIHGFGKFVARTYGARKCYNPITGKIEMLEPSIQPAFVAGPKFRKEINEKI